MFAVRKEHAVVPSLLKHFLPSFLFKKLLCFPCLVIYVNPDDTLIQTIINPVVMN